MKLLSHSLITSIRFYQTHISSLVNRGQSNCIYPVPCSEYAIQQLKTHPVYKALPKSIWRILSCNPLNAKRQALLPRE